MRLTPGLVVTEHIDTPLESRQLYCLVLEADVCVRVSSGTWVPRDMQYIQWDFLFGYTT